MHGLLQLLKVFMTSFQHVLYFIIQYHNIYYYTVILFVHVVQVCCMLEIEIHRG